LENFEKVIRRKRGVIKRSGILSKEIRENDLKETTQIFKKSMLVHQEGILDELLKRGTQVLNRAREFTRVDWKGKWDIKTHGEAEEMCMSTRWGRR